MNPLSKNLLSLACVAICFTATVSSVFSQDLSPKHLTFRAVPFTETHFDDLFWSPRLKINREISIPHNFKWCEDTGRFTNFAKAAKLMDGEFLGIYFNDSDVYKLLEGAAYSLADHPDKALEKQVDDVIAWIAAAQDSDGYLNTYFTLKEPDKKWTNTRVRHELYCAGHLTEAAVAYKQATGKDSLLKVAEKFIEHIMTIFGLEPGQKVEVPGHEEIELALVKLYQLTGKEKYLNLSEFFVEVRGDGDIRTNDLYGPYSQDHKPIRDQDEIVGHAVRAVYLYAGVADVAAYSGDQKLIDAMDRLWNDVVRKKMYITGGIGARHQGEAFGDAFELPNRTAYCETCAAIGLVFWAQRLNLMHGDAQYADVVERCIYNGVLSGIGLDGKSFFYVNPLESAGNHHRQPFFSCACCPTNVVRFTPSLPGYQYAVDKDGPVVNLYNAGSAKIDLEHGELQIVQKTNYPWDGKVSFNITPRRKEGVAVSDYRIKLRVPGEAKYETKTLSWEKPESFEVQWPMDVKRIVANPHVQADLGRVAIQRGPLVYCFEQVDNDVPVNRIVLPREVKFREEFRKDLLGGIVVLKCENADGKELTAVPYYAWDHRAHGRMAVWVRQQGLTKKPDVDDPSWTRPETRQPILYRELSAGMLQSTDEPEDEDEPIVEASHCWGADTVDAICDGIEPKKSNDGSIPRFTFWNHKGTAEWIEITFGKPRKVSRTSIYWYDDSDRGGCRVPASWRLSYLANGKWQPVKTTGSYDTALDRYNAIEFTPVETEALRLDVKLQENFSAGVLEWKVE